MSQQFVLTDPTVISTGMVLIPKIIYQISGLGYSLSYVFSNPVLCDRIELEWNGEVSGLPFWTSGGWINIFSADVLVIDKIYWSDVPDAQDKDLYPKYYKMISYNSGGSSGTVREYFTIKFTPFPVTRLVFFPWNPSSVTRGTFWGAAYKR